MPPESTPAAPAEVAEKPETLTVAVSTVLKRVKNGYTAKEILEKLQARGGAYPAGKTPAATIQSLLSTSNKNGGKFVKLERGKYALRAAA